MYKKYRFVKPLTVKEGTFKAGDEIAIINGHFYFNEGLVQPVFQDLLFDLIEYETNEGFNYLREISFPKPVDFNN